MGVKQIASLAWCGSSAAHLDTIWVASAAGACLGTFGGHSKGGAKSNEDGALLWCGEDWTLGVVIDAHNSSESAEAILDMFGSAQTDLVTTAEKDLALAFADLRASLPAMFLSRFGAGSLGKGEASCAVCFQKGPYILWFSVGDNLSFLLNGELQRIGQSMLNARQYYEWVGERSSFALDVPCYSIGVRELRSGNNLVVLSSDGLLAAAPEWEIGRILYELAGAEPDPCSLVRGALAQVEAAEGRDSASMVAWSVFGDHAATMPSS